MKTYPSIIYPPPSGLGEYLHTFVKLDGSNLRFEWSRKQGWYKAGTRRRLLDETDPIFKPALPLFRETLAEQCAKICTDQKWMRAVVYCEYYGPESFAGLHREGDAMQLTVIDVAPYKQGFLPPPKFLKLFGEVGPAYLGFLKWNQDFITRVREGSMEGDTFEGVVGKSTKGKKLLWYKTKTRAWIEEVKKRYSREDAEKIVAS